jgi:hypothetical protein
MLPSRLVGPLAGAGSRLRHVEEQYYVLFPLFLAAA